MSRLVLLAALTGLSTATECLDESGNGVAWWFIYKMPNGFNYAYKDSNDRTATLAPFTDRTLDRIDGALGDTLHQIYADKKGLAYALYNDEIPSESRRSVKAFLMDQFMPKSILKESPKGAHAKGVVATDGRTGFWLVHSVPKFPDLGPASFTWTADDTYGQSFLCMSLSAAEVDKVGTQLMYFHPTIFDSNMPANIAKSVPNLAGLINGDRIVGTNVEQLTTPNGQTFVSFAKDHDWDSDLYEDLVSPTLKVGFKWETWRRGGVLPTVCAGSGSPFDSINVLGMQIGDTAFKYTQDHAKLGVSTSNSDKGGYVCVGDINRMESQRKRGGGTVCFVTKALWKALSDSITSEENC